VAYNRFEVLFVSNGTIQIACSPDLDQISLKSAKESASGRRILATLSIATTSTSPSETRRTKQ
jgi:hypothetical protein